MTEEKTFFHQGGVRVTSARFINGGQTYAMSNVTSVKALIEKPQRGGGILIALVALGMSIAAPIVGIPALGLTLFYLYKQKPKYHVMLKTSGGEASALSTDHEEYVDDVVEAVNQAIVHRG